MPGEETTPMRLKDRVCIITGGGSGIGRASALLFAREGARLAVADKRLQAAEAVASECTGEGAQALPVEADVARAIDVQRMVAATVAAFGRLDVLVNNAGYGIAGSVVETDEQAWDDLMAVNVRGVYLCCKYAIPAMKANGGGTIVNTASVVAAVGIRDRAAYCASKGAVAALTRAVAIDHVGDGIRCNAVAPGTVDTPYFDRILKTSADPAAVRRKLEERQLLGRLGKPEEIAAAILFLAGDESRFATGTILTIDGGMTAQ
jgi:meso-butanediol dehydrogenase/(S,S)-butanediol dehydrogenase/diacetyl reductase